MVTLPQLLHDAQARRASEIVLKSGQRPRLQTIAGPAELDQVLSASDLFDALFQVLAPEQQAELAVGNVVEFVIDHHGGWSLVTEPGIDGVVVRARSHREAAAHGSSASDSEHEDSYSLELPPLEPFRPDHDTTSAPPRRPTRIDIGVDRGPDEPSTPSESAPPITRVPVGDGAASAAQIGPPPTVANLDAVAGDELEFALVGVTPAAAGRALAVRKGSLAELVAGLGPAALCFVPSHAATDDLVAGLRDAVETIDAGTIDEVLALRLDDIAVGATWVVRLEDPSRCLGFVLRRLEEGGRVIVITRARDGAGAQRTLLGACSGENATRWLAVHQCSFVSEVGGEWRLQAL